MKRFSICHNDDDPRDPNHLREEGRNRQDVQLELVGKSWDAFIKSIAYEDKEEFSDADSAQIKAIIKDIIKDIECLFPREFAEALQEIEIGELT